jgi:adenylyltransferase/sulfurtransferase
LVHGITPTKHTLSSFCSVVKTQVAEHRLLGMVPSGGRGWVFAGLSADSYQIEFQRKEECYSHEPLDEVITLDARADTLTVRQLLQTARDLLGPTAEIELGRDVLEKLICPKCKGEEVLFSSLGKVSAEKAWCPQCKDARREVQTFHKIRGREAFLDQTLAGIGVPAFDILVSRNVERAVGFELSGDGPDVLGAVYDGLSLD